MQQVATPLHNPLASWFRNNEGELTPARQNRTIMSIRFPIHEAVLLQEPSSPSSASRPIIALQTIYIYSAACRRPMVKLMIWTRLLMMEWKYGTTMTCDKAERWSSNDYHHQCADAWGTLYNHPCTTGNRMARRIWTSALSRRINSLRNQQSA